MYLTAEQIRFLNDDYIIPKKMRYVIAALQGYKLPWYLKEVLLQSTVQERDLWQTVENTFVYSKKSNADDAKEMGIVLTALANKAWLEYRTEKAKEEGVQFAQALSPVKLIEQGQQLQFTANPYAQDELNGIDFVEAWRQGFHDYLCLIREESW